MKTLITLALAWATYASDIDSSQLSFNNYITEYGKSYDTVAEYDFRLQQFTRTHLLIV